MAPTKSSKGKGGSTGKPGSASKKSKAPGSAPTGISKRKSKSLALAKPGGAQKTKSFKSKDGKKKKRTYKESELDIPKLNSIIPAGIAKPKGQKKGKVFVDDAESMMAIMSVVNAEKEGHLESKIMRARQLEEVREARRKEAEKRSEDKKAKFEDVKEGLKKKRGKRSSDGARLEDVENQDPVVGKEKHGKGKKKRVSFG